MNWYFKKDGKLKGPITAKQLQALAEKGIIGAGDQVRREDLKEWIRAGDIKGLSFVEREAGNWELSKAMIGGQRIKLECPHCGEPLVVGLDQAGEKDECPQCMKQFRIPSAPAEKLRQESKAAEQKRIEQQDKSEREEVRRAVVAVERRNQSQSQRTAEPATNGTLLNWAIKNGRVFLSVLICIWTLLAIAGALAFTVGMFCLVATAFSDSPLLALGMVGLIWGPAAVMFGMLGVVACSIAACVFSIEQNVSSARKTAEDALSAKDSR